MKRLLKKQQQINPDINACNDKNKRKLLQSERNKALKEIHQILADEEDQKITNRIEDIEKYEDDSNRMYHAVRSLKKIWNQKAHYGKWKRRTNNK